METITVDEFKSLHCKRRTPGQTTRGEPNQTERDFITFLKASDLVREVYPFESITLRVGHDCRYTPDVPACGQDGALELYEVKGHRRDDAMAKLRAAAGRFAGCRFYLVERRGQGWRIKKIPAR